MEESQGARVLIGKRNHGIEGYTKRNYRDVFSLYVGDKFVISVEYAPRPNSKAACEEMGYRFGKEMVDCGVLEYELINGKRLTRSEEVLPCDNMPESCLRIFRETLDMVLRE